MNTKENFDSIMEAARQMQKSMEIAQKQLNLTEETGEAGNGAVKITTNCHNIPVRVFLDDSLQGKDMRTLEELVLTAMKDVAQKVNQTSQDTLMSVTKGIHVATDISLLEKAEQEEGV